jgi:hypothetical protein
MRLGSMCNNDSKRHGKMFAGIFGIYVHFAKSVLCTFMLFNLNPLGRKKTLRHALRFCLTDVK